MAVNNNESENRPEAKIDSLAIPDNTGNTQARREAVRSLNNPDSLALFEENAWQNPGDPLQPLAVMDHGQNVAAEEHHGHSHGKHSHPHSGDDTAPAATAATDTSGQNLLVKDSMLAALNPAEAIQLAAMDPAALAQLAALNPGEAVQAAALNPALAAQLAASNSGYAAMLWSQNPTLAKGLGIRNPNDQPSPNDQQNV
jgi:hypothetical protein